MRHEGRYKDRSSFNSACAKEWKNVTMAGTTSGLKLAT